MVVALLLAFSLNASVIVQSKVYPGSIMLPLFNSGKMISLNDFMKLKPSGYKKLTGKRMNLKEITSKMIYGFKRLNKMYLSPEMLHQLDRRQADTGRCAANDGNLACESGHWDLLPVCD